jgi:hypothetical protein
MGKTITYNYERSKRAVEGYANDVRKKIIERMNPAESKQLKEEQAREGHLQYLQEHGDDYSADAHKVGTATRPVKDTLHPYD